MDIAKDFSTKREYIENFIYNLFNNLDTTGSNTSMYKSMFDSMSDNQFKKFAEDLASFKQYLYLDIEAFKREPSINDLHNAAKIENIPLYEYVIFYDKQTGKWIKSASEVPVGYLHVKRVQQLVIKKNTTTTDISKRNPKSGQVTGESKTVRDSDMENYMLSVSGLENIQKEFLGPRADDMVMKETMYRNISKNGTVSLSELPNMIENKVALNTLDTYFTSMGLKTDLITDGLLLQKTMVKLNKNAKDSVSDKYTKG